MALTFPSIASTRIDAESPLEEDLMTDFNDRDDGNSVKPVDIEYTATTSTASSGSPTTLLSQDYFIPVDADELVFECEVKNSDGATTGTLRITVGAATAATISIASGDTSFTFKNVTVTLDAGDIGARTNVLVELWRDTGTGNVESRAAGVISRWKQSG